MTGDGVDDAACAPAPRVSRGVPAVLRWSIAVAAAGTWLVFGSVDAASAAGPGSDSAGLGAVVSTVQESVGVVTSVAAPAGPVTPVPVVGQPPAPVPTVAQQVVAPVAARVAASVPPVARVAQAAQVAPVAQIAAPIAPVVASVAPPVVVPVVEAAAAVEVSPVVQATTGVVDPIVNSAVGSGPVTAVVTPVLQTVDPIAGALPIVGNTLGATPAETLTAPLTGAADDVLEATSQLLDEATDAVDGVGASTDGVLSPVLGSVVDLVPDVVVVGRGSNGPALVDGIAGGIRDLELLENARPAAPAGMAGSAPFLPARAAVSPAFSRMTSSPWIAAMLGGAADAAVPRGSALPAAPVDTPAAPVAPVSPLSPLAPSDAPTDQSVDSHGAGGMGAVAYWIDESPIFALISTGGTSADSDALPASRASDPGSSPD